MNSYEVFIAVTDLKSFSKAARKLHRSPSAISKHIALLEEKLGVQLLVRTTRSLNLTSAGHLYYERCKDIAQRMEHAQSELREHAAEPSGKLKLTWPNVLTNTDITKSLGEFCHQYPEIKLDVQVTPELLNLSKENIDFAFRVSKLEDSNLIAKDLGTIQTILCASPSFLEKHPAPDSIVDTLNLPQIVPSYVNFAQGIKKWVPEVKGFETALHHQINDISALHQMALLGLGVAFIGKHVVEEDLKAGRLINLTGDSLPKLPIYLMYAKQEYLPKRNRCFIDFFKAKFSEKSLVE